jgi:integrase
VDVTEFLSKGVKPKTSKGHERNFTAWSEFLARRGAGAYLLLDNLNALQRRKLVVDFIFDMKVTQRKPQGHVKRALQSLQWFLTVNGREVLWLREDASIKLARKACKPSGRELHIAREKRRRLPVSYDMVLWIQEHFGNNGVDGFMIALGILIAFHFILRISEYVAHADNEHAIQCGDVAFITYEGDRIAPQEVGRGRHRFEDFENILIDVRSAKQDSAGKGRHLFLSRDSPAETHLMHQMFEWCLVANHRCDEDPFLSRYTGNRRKKLNASMVNGALKTMATAFGIDKAHMSSHCVKIGGTTMMAAGKVDRGQIRRLAGWSDEGRTDQIYSHNTPIDRGALSIVDSAVRLFSAKDVKRMLPTRFSRAPAPVLARPARRVPA